MTMPPPEPPQSGSSPDDENRPAPPSEPPAAAPPPPPPPPPPAAGGYGAEPPPAGGYGTQPGYGAPQPGYGAPQPGYGGPPPGYPTQPGPAMPYADWPKRALSGLIDFLGPYIVAYLFYFANRPLGIVLILAALAWGLYNAYLGGQTGQSYGKKIAGTRLVLEATGQPIGGGLGIGRYFVHIVDSIPCYLGFLWPLWDSKRQTFADKLLKTVVVPV